MIGWIMASKVTCWATPVSDLSVNWLFDVKKQTSHHRRTRIQVPSLQMAVCRRGGEQDATRLQARLSVRVSRGVDGAYTYYYTRMCLGT